MYIGQTRQSFIKRYYHHVWKLNDKSHDNRYLQHAWNKYGENDFVFSSVDSYDNIEFDRLNELEMQYIQKYDTFNNGFNLTLGGDGARGCKMSAEAIEKIRERNRKANLGKKASEETKRRMSESRKGRKMPEHVAEKLRQANTGSKHSDEAKLKMRMAKQGSKSRLAVINNDIAEEIKKRLITKESRRSIAESLKIPIHIVDTIVKNRTWENVYVKGWDEYINDYNATRPKPLSDENVRLVRRMLHDGNTPARIARDIGCGIGTVTRIRDNKGFKNVI